MIVADIAGSPQTNCQVKWLRNGRSSESTLPGTYYKAFDAWCPLGALASQGFRALGCGYCQ
jgi:hypothetical protein